MTRSGGGFLPEAAAWTANVSAVDSTVRLPVAGVRLSLWKALARFRVATLLICLFLIIRWRPIYAHWSVALAAGAGMIAVTAVVSWLAERGLAHRASVVLADIVATAGLTLATLGAQTAPQHLGGMPTLTTIWAAGPAIEAGFVFGWFGGVAAGAVQTIAAAIVRQGYDGRTLSNGVIIVIAGAVSGYVAAVVVRAEAELAAASATRAAVAERERLARTVHDGVLQVLGLVHRTGRDAAPPWSALASEAATQEVALRTLISSRDPLGSGDSRSLTDALRELRTDRVTVSTPGDALPLDAHRVGEIADAVRAALHNVEIHAGAEAKAWVLLEDLDGAVRITVRDDGTGFDARRLAAAQDAGRLGIVASIRGRIADLGGTTSVESEPGSGTVVEMSIPT